MYLALVFFLWGSYSQTCVGSKPRSTQVIPRGACRHDCERCCALEAIRFKSCSYGLLLTIWGLMCIFSFLWHYVLLLIHQARGAGSPVVAFGSRFAKQARGSGSWSALEGDKEVFSDKPAKEDINLISQKMFSYAPYESHQYWNNMLLANFFRSSQSHLCADPRQEPFWYWGAILSMMHGGDAIDGKGIVYFAKGYSVSQLCQEVPIAKGQR